MRSLVNPDLRGPEQLEDTLRKLDAVAPETELLESGLAPVTAAFIASAAKLRAIVKHGVGVDNIDVAAATRRKIPVINAPGVNANAVAELALGFMIALARNMCAIHGAITSGGWMRDVGTEIRGKTLGVVGLGAIGRSLADKALALGMRVLATDLRPDADFCAKRGILIRSLSGLLAEADYVSLHVFGGKGNANLIGGPELDLMKPTACLMNLARGEVVDLDALADRLAAGRLGGAAIDAYAVEPPDRSHPIFRQARVVFTAHSGGDTVESMERVGRFNIEDFDRVLAGQRPVHVVNPEIYG